MRVQIFQGYVDPQARPPAGLLEAWPTLPGVAGGVARAGARVEVVVAARHDERFDLDGVSYRFVAEHFLPSLRSLLGSRAAPHPARTLRAAGISEPDVVHLHGLSFPFQARALRRLHPRAKLLAQDHADRPPTGLRCRLHRWGHGVLDGAIFTSPEQALPFFRSGILPEGLPVFDVPEGSSLFSPGDRDEARRLLGISGAPAVGWVGRMTPGKDPLTAVEAFRFVARRLPDARLWMASPGGPLQDTVMRRVSEDPELRLRVHLLGALPHARVETFLRACDVFLTASRHEGSGYALVEALACGVPVVASHIPSHVSLLGPTTGGITAPCGDAPALGHALEALVGRRAEAALEARRRFEEALTFDAIGRRLLAVYREVVASSIGRGSHATAP